MADNFLNEEIKRIHTDLCQKITDASILHTAYLTEYVVKKLDIKKKDSNIKKKEHFSKIMGPFLEKNVNLNSHYSHEITRNNVVGKICLSTNSLFLRNLLILEDAIATLLYSPDKNIEVSDDKQKVTSHYRNNLFVGCSILQRVFFFEKFSCTDNEEKPLDVERKKIDFAQLERNGTMDKIKNNINQVQNLYEYCLEAKYFSLAVTSRNSYFSDLLLKLLREDGKRTDRILYEYNTKYSKAAESQAWNWDDSELNKEIKNFASLVKVKSQKYCYNRETKIMHDIWINFIKLNHKLSKNNVLLYAGNVQYSAKQIAGLIENSISKLHSTILQYALRILLMKTFCRNDQNKYYEWLHSFIKKHRRAINRRAINRARFDFYDILPTNEAYFVAYYTGNQNESIVIGTNGKYTAKARVGRFLSGVCSCIPKKNTSKLSKKALEYRIKNKN